MQAQLFGDAMFLKKVLRGIGIIRHLVPASMPALIFLTSALAVLRADPSFGAGGAGMSRDLMDEEKDSRQLMPSSLPVDQEQAQALIESSVDEEEAS